MLPVVQPNGGAIVPSGSVRAIVAGGATDPRCRGLPIVDDADRLRDPQRRPDAAGCRSSATPIGCATRNDGGCRGLPISGR
jgi:hypothetical protein